MWKIVQPFFLSSNLTVRNNNLLIAREIIEERGECHSTLSRLWAILSPRLRSKVYQNSVGGCLEVT